MVEYCSPLAYGADVEAAVSKPPFPLRVEEGTEKYPEEIASPFPWERTDSTYPPLNPIQRMTMGLPYFATDPLCQTYRLRAQALCSQYNAYPVARGRRMGILRDLLGTLNEPICIETPFRVDYGFNVHTRPGFYANFGLTILDEAPVTFGAGVFLGPSVEIYTANHPIDPARREVGLEDARPVTIGDRCWIGGRCVILPGVTIGKCSVIGAGSVVVRDIPEFSVAVGNPARVVKSIPREGHEKGLAEHTEGCDWFREVMEKAGLGVNVV